MAYDALYTHIEENRTTYELELLTRARQPQLFYDMAKKTKLPDNGGTTVQWRRFNALANATTPITEGVTPTESNLSITPITATIQQYGNVVGYTDMLQIHGIDDFAKEAIDVLGQNAGETVEQLFSTVLGAGTNVLYATGSTRGGLASSNVLTLALLQRAAATLKQNKARKYNADPMTGNAKIGGGKIIVVISPEQEYDLKRDTDVKAALQNGNSDKFWTGAIAEIDGMEIYVANDSPRFAGQGSGGANVYGALVFGMEAFGAVDCGSEGGKFVLKSKPLGSAGTADALDQRGSQGWKAKQAMKILNNAWIVRVETGATIG